MKILQIYEYERYSFSNVTQNFAVLNISTPIAPTQANLYLGRKNQRFILTVVVRYTTVYAICMTCNIVFTEDPRFNDNVCYQRFCCKIEFAVLKKLDRDPSKT